MARIVPRRWSMRVSFRQCLRVTSVFLLVAVTLACAPAPGPSAQAPPAPTPTPSAQTTRQPTSQAAPSPSPAPGFTVESMATAMAQDPRAQAAVEAAVGDALSRTGAQPSEVRVERAERREWPDASLGCPQPGMLYAQVITAGYLVEVSAGGKRLEYHTDERGTRAVLCRES